MDISLFLEEHQLPDSYKDIAQKWFIPLAEDLAMHYNSAIKPYFVGINGCQGSGKSTLCDFLVYYLSQHKGLNVVSLSLDDFYFDQSHRNALAVKVHPLLATRGVPGTHNTPLALKTFDQLGQYGTASIPRFNKATDNPYSVIEWPVVNTPVDIVLMEGWCWGVMPQEETALSTPVNTLEKQEDPLGIWSRYVNRQLTEHYLPLYERMQCWIMLKAPSFDQVYQWRTEQEHKLAARVGSDHPGIMTDQQIARFIQHYQRLTEHGLSTLPARCDYVFHLDAQRQINQLTKKQQKAVK